MMQIYIWCVNIMHELAITFSCDVATLAVVIFVFLVPAIIIALVLRCVYLEWRVSESTILIEDIYGEEIYSHDKEEDRFD